MNSLPSDLLEIICNQLEVNELGNFMIAKPEILNYARELFRKRRKVMLKTHIAKKCKQDIRVLDLEQHSGDKYIFVNIPLFYNNKYMYICSHSKSAASEFEYTVQIQKWS